MFPHLITIYKSWSFQTKLFLSYFVLLFVPLTTLTFFSYSQSSKIIIDQSMITAELNLVQLENLVGNELSKAVNFSQLVAQDAEVREFAESRDNSFTFSHEFDTVKELTKKLYSMSELSEIYKVRLFVSPKFMYSRSNDIINDITQLEKAEWYSQLTNSNRNSCLTAPYMLYVPMNPSVPIISAVTLIRNESDVSDIVGVAVVDIDISRIEKLFAASTFAKDGKILLLDSNSDIILQTESELISDTEISDSLPVLYKAFPKEVGVTTHGSFCAGITNPLSEGWRICTFVSLDEMLAHNRSLRNRLLSFAVIVGVIVFMLAYFYSRSTARSIKQLASLMDRVKKGDTSVKCIVDSDDEIGKLQSSFNFMTDEISLLLQERYDIGKSLKETELKALQAQINPHFLYNTLDLISWKAYQKGNDELNDIVCKMARFYRLSLSNGNDFIKLSDEFEHIRLYVELQNLRFEHTIILETELDPQIEDCLIMKLILQPIVENSIMHGILDCPDKSGTIKISAKKINDRISISVSDNGSGMDKERLTEIRAHEDSSNIANSKSGFGLLNIIDRLKIYYTNYLFDITSSLGEGTTVLIEFPITPSNGQKQ